MPLHPVVDQVARSVPLDLPSAVLYAVLFGAVLAATLRRPAYGIATLVALAPFAFYHQVGPTTLTLSKVALIAMAVGLGLRHVRLDVLRAPAARALLICAALVSSATALSIAQAAHRGPALRETLKALEYLAIFITVVIAARADADERPVRYAFAGTVLAVSLLALGQELFGAPSGMWLSGHPIPRIAGPLEGPNQLAGYLEIALSVVAAFTLARRQLVLELAGLAAGVAALVLTLSRTGLLAAIVALTIVVVVSPQAPRRRAYAAAAIGFASGAVVLLGWGLIAAHAGDVLARYATLAEAADPGTVGTRSQLWHAAIVLWRRHPVLGIGGGNFELELAAAGFPHIRTHANSLYLQSLVEGGLPLLGATLLLVATAAWRFVRGPFTEPFIVAALAASVAFALHQILDLLVFYPKIGELWWILLALAAARYDALRAAARDETPAVRVTARG